MGGRPIAACLLACAGLWLLAPGCRSRNSTASASSSSGQVELEPGSHDRVVEVAGEDRRYRVIVGPEAPAAAERGGAPLVFSWHGFSSNLDWHSRHVEGMVERWPEAVFVVPQGLPRTFERFGRRARPGWQVQVGEHGDRDLAFFDAMLAELLAELPIDEGRIHSTGMSNGGFFSQLLACERAELIASIAPVAGGAPWSKRERCQSPVPVRIVHGRRDHIVPYELAREGYELWVEVNGCAPSSAPDAPGCVEARGCAAATEFCAHAVGHRWPPEGNREVIDFLRAHPRLAGG